MNNKSRVKYHLPETLLKSAGYKIERDKNNWVKELGKKSRLHAVIKGEFPNFSIYIHRDVVVNRDHEASSYHPLVKKEVIDLKRLKKELQYG